MGNKKYDDIIVGAGVAGSTLAKELSRKNRKILVIEKGTRETSYGSFKDCMRYFDTGKTKFPIKSKEGVTIYRTIMAGGSGFVSAGNLVRSMEEELKEMGLDLSSQFEEAEEELTVGPISDRLMSPGSRAIREAARELGVNMEPMPKAINPKRCIKCGKCTLGCKTQAKWTPIVYLDEAMDQGVDVLFGDKVERVLQEQGAATGVSVRSDLGVYQYEAERVFLAAGGLGTPRILLHSGIDNAGTNLFIDPFVLVYGLHPTLNLLHEPQMSLVCDQFHKSKGFILSPHVNQPVLLRYIEAGMKGTRLDPENLLGLMVKITDDASGSVDAHGTVHEFLSEADQKKLDEGVKVAKEILLKTGVDPESLLVTKPAGAHPGGTAALGEVVDMNMETKMKNLFVCDASILPKAPGLPPILTIIALAKKLASNL